MNQLEDLLKECTVQIRVPSGSGLGTGFFVASALLLTCDHVVQGSENGVIEARCWGQQQWVKAKVEKSLPKPYDLALVKVVLPESIDHPPCVYLGEEIQSRDPLCSFGFPDEGDREGEPRTFNSDGTTGSDVASILFKLGQVRPGMSGSALLNQRTGKVCGMVQFTRDRSIDLGGGALTTRVILEQFPELRNLQKEFHQRDIRWREHLKWDGSPYPGLYAFEKADAPIFFGRNDDIQEGIEELRNLRDRKERLFIYLGASGSGKSSLVRAGLVPELEKTHHTKHWIVVSPFRPINEGWGDPFKNLADVLSAAFEEHGTPRDSDSIQEQLSNPRQHHGLLEVVRDLTKVAKQRQATVLIIIDQFEELLGQTASDQAQEFLTWFGEGMVAAQQLPAPMLIVLAVIRSDFLPEFQQSTLQPSVKIFPKLVNPIPVERFGELIEGPANLVGLKLQTGLTQQIVSDANTANSLPLLAFTLAKLYEQYGQDGLIEIKEYETLGKLKGSVSQEAQRIFDSYLVEANLEKEAGDRLLRQAFLKLVRLDANGNAARRLATWQELPVAAQPLMEKFVAGRLLTKRVNEDKVNSHDIQTQHNLQTLVEVSHEALFTAWPLLRDCIDNSRGHLLDKQKIEASVITWQEQGQQPGYLLQGEPLRKAIQFQKQHTETFPLSDTTKDFIQKSIGYQRRGRLKTTSLVFIPVILLLLGVVEYRLKESTINDYYELIQEQTRTPSMKEAVVDLVSGCHRQVRIREGWGWLDRYLTERLFGNCRSLANVDLSDADLRNADLRNADLRDANLTNADLTTANLRNVDLSSASTRQSIELGLGNRRDLCTESRDDCPNALDAMGINSDYRGANLRDTNLTSADLRGANLSDTILVSANFRNANLSGVNLSGADLSNANLSNTDIRDAILVSANLKNANLVSADLNNADLTNTRLDGSDLRDANLNGTNLRLATFNDSLLIATNLRGNNLTARQLKPTRFLEENLSPYLCNVALPSNIKNIDFDQDCDVLPQILTKRKWFLALDVAEEIVSEARQQQWD